jgi:hypothetical protein
MSFYFFFLRKHSFFQENHISANMWDKINFAQGLGWELIMQFSPLGFLLAAWGFGVAWRNWYVWLFNRG